MATITILAPQVSGRTDCSLYLHDVSDGSLTNTGGDALTETASSNGQFTSNVAESISVDHYAIIDSTALGIVGYGYLASGETTVTDAPVTPLNAAGVRAAVGLATADLDTQLAAVPTAAEINTAVETGQVGTDAATAAAIPTDGSLTVTMANNVVHGGNNCRIELETTSGTHPPIRITNNSGPGITVTATSLGISVSATSGYGLRVAGTLADVKLFGTGTLEGDLDGDVTGAINTAAGTITTLDGLDTAQDTQHAATLTRLGTPAGADVSTDIANLVTTVGVAGAGLTDIGGMSTGMKAEMNAEVLDVLNVDTLIYGLTIVTAIKRTLVASGNATLSGAGTGTEVMTSPDSAETATFTVDGSGNVTAVVWA